MKRNFMLTGYFIIGTMFVFAQNVKRIYPEPEFSNEVNFLEKDTGYRAVRLEKNSAQLTSKTKWAVWAVQRMATRLLEKNRL